MVKMEKPRKKLIISKYFFIMKSNVFYYSGLNL